MNQTVSIEDQIAEHYVAPTPQKRICAWVARPDYPACTTPLAQSNKENLCYRHAQLEKTLKTMAAFSTALPGDAVAPRRRMFPNALPPIKPIKAIAPLPPIQPLPPIPPIEEMTPVTEENQQQVSTCAVKDCDVVIMNNNKSGRCTKHFYITKGMTMKDGSIPRPKTPAQPRPVAPAEPRLCAVMNCQTPLAVHNRTGRCDSHYVVQNGMQMKDGSIPKPHTPISLRMAETRARNAAAGGALPTATLNSEPEGTEIFIPRAEVVTVAEEYVSVKVPIDALDRFWSRLPLVDKTRIVERELFGGL